MHEKNEPLNATLFIIALTFSVFLVSACSSGKQSTTTIMANINGYSFDNNRQLQQFQTLVLITAEYLQPVAQLLRLIIPKPTSSMARV